MKKELLNVSIGFTFAALVTIVALAIGGERAHARSTYSDTSWQGSLASMTAAAWNQAYWAKRSALAAEKCACE